MGKKIELDKDILYQMYIVQELPMHKIAEQIGIAVGTVFKYIKKYGIESRPQHKGFEGKTHTPEVHKKISDFHRGKTVSRETRQKMSQAKKKGGIGHKKIRDDGYITIYFPDHPKSNQDGYIMEHVLVMEALIGRHLNNDECVHHINENKQDNRKENLQLMTKSEHMRYHGLKRWREKRRDDLSIR